MNLQNFTVNQRLWILENPDLARSVVSKAAESAMALVVAREDRRKKLLELIDKRVFPGHYNFSFKRFQERGEPGYSTKVAHIGGWFNEWFAPKVEENISPGLLGVSRILSGSIDVPYATETEIRQNLGERRFEISLAEACSFLTTIEATYWYCFFARDVNGILRSINARWYKVGYWKDKKGETYGYGRGWYISATPSGSNNELQNGGCVVHRL